MQSCSYYFSCAAADSGIVTVKDSTFKMVLADVLTFTTGMPVEPPLGFSPLPSLTFTFESKFPTANTCANVLYIPLEHTCYTEFVWHMCYGILNTAGFGQI